MKFYDKVELPGTTAYYTAYVYDKSPEYSYNDRRASVVFCPGGGYEMTSDREAEPMALQYFAAGFNVFIVRYRVGRQSFWPNPQYDVMQALKDIRSKADIYNIFVDKIALCGFSAGGHLVASIGVHWNDKELCETVGVAPEEARPNALLLYYPVIKGFEYTHEGSIMNQMQNDPENEKLRHLLSLEENVSKDTPPTFIGHSSEDGCVPVVCSLDFARALYVNGVPFEMYICEKGQHGLATGDRNTNPDNHPGAAEWTAKAVSWLREKFEFLN